LIRIKHYLAHDRLAGGRCCPTHEIVTGFAGINNLPPFVGRFPEATGFSNVTCFLQVHEISIALSRTQIQLVNHPASRASILCNPQDAQDNVLASSSSTFTRHGIRPCSFYSLRLHDPYFPTIDQFFCSNNACNDSGLGLDLLEERHERCNLVQAFAQSERYHTLQVLPFFHLLFICDCEPPANQRTNDDHEPRRPRDTRGTGKDRISVYASRWSKKNKKLTPSTKRALNLLGSVDLI
jgi:hypothetical protein